jgi:hypothetical protein
MVMPATSDLLMSGSVYSRRLEDRIRDLCATIASSKVIDSTDGVFEAAVSELQSTVAELLLRIQNRTSVAILAWPDFPQDRRKYRKIE